MTQGNSIFSDTTGLIDIYTNSERRWKHIQDLNKFKPARMPPLRRGNEYKVPSLTIYLQMTSARKEEISFSQCSVLSLGGSTTFQWRPHVQEYSIIFVCFCFGILCFLDIFKLSVFLLFVLEKEREKQKPTK